MDVLRKELNRIYAAQHLECEMLPQAALEHYRQSVSESAILSMDCRIITDASADRSYMYGGAQNIIPAGTNAELKSSDEDEIYARMHPEDLVEKRMLEYEFFSLMDSMPSSEKMHHKATCTIRLKAPDGTYLHVDNSTQILCPSPKGKIWLILCCYALSPHQQANADIHPRIINTLTGKIHIPSLGHQRQRILSEREKEVLNLIRIGKPSKQIADALHISIHTVNRHRQNILEKLSVANSAEAIMAATAMKLL